MEIKARRRENRKVRATTIIQSLLLNVFFKNKKGKVKQTIMMNARSTVCHSMEQREGLI